MTLRRCAIALAVAVMCAPSAAHAMGKTFAMGGIYSVLSDGAYDAAKNPALLPLHTEGMAAGIIAQSAVGTSIAGSTDIFFQSTSRTVNTALYDNRLATHSGGVCFLTRLGDSVLGLSLTGGDDPLYLSIASRNRLATSESGVYEADRSDVKSNPTFNLSWGIALSSRSSIGVILTGSYTVRHRVEGTSISSSGREVYYLTKTIDTSSTAASLGFGYLHRTDDAQAGIAVTSGDVSWIGETAGFDFADKRHLMNPTIEDRSRSEDLLLTNNNVYSKAPALVAGGYRRLSPLFAVVIEGQYRLGISYRVRSGNISGPNSQGECRVDEISVVTRQGGVASLRGGIEFNPFSGLAVMIGASYTDEYSDTSKDAESGTKLVTSGKESHSVTGGVVYESPQRFSVGLIVAYTDVVIRERERDAFSDNDDSTRLSSRLTLRLVTVGLGFQYIF